MPVSLTRIFSDVHYGDHASRVQRLAQLRPLLDGVTHLVLNGDTLDTRRGPRPAYTAQLRADVLGWAATSGLPTTLLTGNHDPDLTGDHTLELADQRVFVTHGDINFDNIVPWGRDAAAIERLLAAGLAELAPAARDRLEDRLALWRRVSAQIPQRHQSEANRLKYLLHFAGDTVWPPLRIFRILAAWRHAPDYAAALTRRHRPRAQFVLNGHTHRPGVWRHASGVTVINTGSFCPPSAGYAVDVSPDRLSVRQIEFRGGDYHPGPAVAEFALADAPASPTLAP
ncbi:MAG: metallophosphoesterase family protein [Verrucomicrobia bacterium]|nr:metallophosphoesterase family protein [Verrucomicrobiota bacterium]